MKIVVRVADILPVDQIGIELDLPLITVAGATGYDLGAIVRKTMKEYKLDP